MTSTGKQSQMNVDELRDVWQSLSADRRHAFAVTLHLLRTDPEARKMGVVATYELVTRKHGAGKEPA